MKQFIGFFSLLITLQTINAQNISFEQAQQVANSFLGKDKKTNLQCSHIGQKDGQVGYYVFDNDHCYVVVSASKQVTPILAYSLQNNFNYEQLSPGAKMWLDHYQNQITVLNQKQIDNIAAVQQWNTLLSDRKATRKSIAEVSPLLSSNWGQGTPYNYYCPKDADGPNERCVTGCVPTALAMLLHYFQFPDSGTGQYSRFDDNYGTLSADFSQSFYNHAAMSDNPTSVSLATGKLISDLGIACDIVYGPNASGMYNHKAAYALKTYFKYDPQTQYLFRDSVSFNWDSLMVSCIDKKIPLYYAGWSVPDTIGHAFICDGYQLDNDSNYYFHFNFGWDGSSNGYFLTNSLYPSVYDFNLAQEIIIAYPDTTNYSYPATHPLTGSRTFTGLEGFFDDGSSRIANVNNSMNFVWHITPETDTITSIDLHARIELAQGDTVWFELNNASQQILTYTDTTLFLNETVTQSREITVRLSTTSNQSEGIAVSYQCNRPVFCSLIKMHNNQSGTISDGSGDYDYNNFTYCRHKITITGKTAIVVKFSQFETEVNQDSLVFYDLQNNRNLLLKLSGTITDSVYYFNTNNLMVEFHTNESQSNRGWEFSYYGDFVGIEQAQSNNLKIYPNPSQNQLTIELNNMETSQEKLEIIDMLGQKIISIPLLEQKSTIDISNLSKGFYLLQIGQSIRKFVKN